MSQFSDIFGYKRNPKPRGVFSTENSMLTFGTGGTTGTSPIGYLVQSWTVNYQQQVQELFEIGSNALYWAKGRPTGGGNIGRIIGDVDADSPSKGFFPSTAYDLCLGGALVQIQAKSGACENFAAKTVTITMDGVVVTGVGFAMQAANVMLQENLQWRFAAMMVS